MKILLLHNSYQFRGGEDIVVEQEHTLLREHGHDVRLVLEYNNSISGITGAVSAAVSAIYSARSRRRMAEELGTFRPDVVHVHNFFPLLSPSVYLACHDAAVPVVQTLHNYRLICPGALLFREGRPCEDCIGRSVPWPGVLHGCYRGSRPGTAAVAAMLVVHNARQTWRDRVDVYVALSQFAREEFVQGGLPAEKIIVKPNFADLNGNLAHGNGEFALYAGRLVPEKGVSTMVAAWRHLTCSVPLRICGEGPLLGDLQAQLVLWDSQTITFAGRIARTELINEMKKARFLLFPSEWYESFPMTIVEAFACGIPVIASRLGAMQEIVSDGITGLLFNPGDPMDLAQKAEWAWTHPGEMREMGKAARKEYEMKYTAAINYQQLLGIYHRAMESRGACTNFAA